MKNSQDIRNRVKEYMERNWDVRQANTVPEDSTLTLTGRVAKLDATVLYADMRSSSKLVDEVNQKVSGKIYQAFLHSLASIIHSNGGEITAYDGDRVMGIFIGNNKNDSAATSALMINYAVKEILKPMLEGHFKSLNRSSFQISHCVGIDTGSFLAVKAGLRNANDIVWIGRPPNLAAKLSEIREGNYSEYITSEVFQGLSNSLKYGGEKSELMWDQRSYKYLDEEITIYSSDYYMSF
jgi:class 3 adenylate cyclase